ncbi:PDDEXK family nuclease [Raoultella planticola]
MSSGVKSQWHCDVVVVDITTFAIVAAVELDEGFEVQSCKKPR